MSSIRILPERLPSGVGRWGRRNAQKAPHKAAKDPYKPDLLGRLFRLRLTPLRRNPTTGAARTGCRGATNGQPNQQAFHQRSGHNRRYKEEFHRRTFEPNRGTMRRCLTITVIFGQLPSTCPPAWRLDQRVVAVLSHEEVGGAVDAEVGDHGWSLQPCHLVRLMTKVTPTKFARLRLTVVSRGMGARPYLNAKSVAPN